MNALLIYLVKASVAMALLYPVYWFFLRKETCFAANRAYLLGAMLISIMMPLFPMTYTVWVHPAQPTVFEAITDAFVMAKPAEQLLAATTPSAGKDRNFLRRSTATAASSKQRGRLHRGGRNANLPRWVLRTGTICPQNNVQHERNSLLLWR